MAFEGGQSAVVVPVPDAEPLVGAARERYDSATLGVPAHVTVVYPFLPLTAVTPAVVGELAAVVAAVPAPTVTFAAFARFPGVLYLDPSPAEPFVRLTRALVAHWPEAPPYGGRHGDDVVPHLTVTSSADPDTIAVVERELSPSLPVTTTLREAVVLGFDGTRWSVRHRLPFS